MARQRKSLDEQIRSLDGQISKVQERLNILLEQKESLVAKRREEEIGELYGLMKEKDMSVDDLYSLIESFGRIEEQHTA